jgi:hypothetical protein
MSKPKLLYLCLNDGSDTRINKEVRTLSGRFAVHYVGIGRSQEQSFVMPYCAQFTLIRGHHKEKMTFARYLQKATRLLRRGEYHSVHLINEQLVWLFFPFLYRHQTVLDIFDSVFLKAVGRLGWLQRVTYRLPSTILVTDENRRGLMPARFLPKVKVLENYPYRYTAHPRKEGGSDELLIFYNGSMSRSRGTELLRSLLELDEKVRVKMAGWVYDEPTRELSTHPRVDFLGVISQQESMQVAASCDYILSLYEPVNQNNINASPNKIYDAIQARTPVIINREVKIAAFVEAQDIGYVLDSFYATRLAGVKEELIARKGSYRFSADLLGRYTWEAVEDKLLAAHGV